MQLLFLLSCLWVLDLLCQKVTLAWLSRVPPCFWIHGSWFHFLLKKLLYKQKSSFIWFYFLGYLSECFLSTSHFAVFSFLDRIHLLTVSFHYSYAWVVTVILSQFFLWIQSIQKKKLQCLGYLFFFFSEKMNLYFWDAAATWLVKAKFLILACKW